MGALRSALVLAVVLAIAAPTAAQLPTSPETVGETANQALDTALPVAENQTGRDVTSEQIDIQLVMDVQNAEFDLVGVLLGGGKAETTIDVEANLAIYAVNVSRLEAAVNQSTERSDVTLSGTFGVDTNQSALTAEQIRSVAGGELLRAFRPYQEQATRSYVEESIPQVTVLSSSFTWQNTRPVEDERESQDVTLRDPPIVLNASLQLRFLDRFSLVDLLESKISENSTGTSPSERLRQRIEQNQTEPFLQRDAPKILGVGQLLSLDLPPGWSLNFTMKVPKGYTISGATDALEVSPDKSRASYFLDGSQRATAASTSGVVKLSDRSLVATTLVTGVAIAGVVVRIPLEMGVLALRRRLL